MKNIKLICIVFINQKDPNSKRVYMLAFILSNTIASALIPFTSTNKFAELSYFDSV